MRAGEGYDEIGMMPCDSKNKKLNEATKKTNALQFSFFMFANFFLNFFFVEFCEKKIYYFCIFNDL